MNKEKNQFLLGLTSTVAVIAIIGLSVMSVAYLKKGGADTCSATGPDQAAANNVVANQPSPTPTPTPTPPPSVPSVNTNAANIKITSSDHVRGNVNAPVTIVEFSDFECPYCARFYPTLEQVMTNYPNDVRWVYKHFPLTSIHPYAQKAAEASECAGEQGKFWEYSDDLYAHNSELNTAYLSTAAKNVGLNTDKFDTCLSSGKYADKVASDLALGQSLGVNGTPGSFINGQPVTGAVPYQQIQSVIDSLLKK